jgi:hypothetical protein
VSGASSLEDAGSAGLRPDATSRWPIHQWLSSVTRPGSFSCSCSLRISAHRMPPTWLAPGAVVQTYTSSRGWVQTHQQMMAADTNDLPIPAPDWATVRLLTWTDSAMATCRDHSQMP